MTRAQQVDRAKRWWLLGWFTVGSLAIVFFADGSGAASSIETPEDTVIVGAAADAPEVLD